MVRGYLSTFNPESLHTSTRRHSQPRGVIVFTYNIVRYYHVGHTIVTWKTGHLNLPKGKLERKFQLGFNNVVRVFWGEREVRKTLSAQKRVQENT